MLLGAGRVGRVGQGRRLAAGVPLAPITEIAADGWTATRRDTSNTARVLNQEFTINEPGFDGNGNATTHSFTMANYCRLREQGTTNTSATLSALSRTVFQGATAQGVVNNSTRVPVKPAILWDMPDVLSISPGETLTFSALISSAHANFGRQIARWRLLFTDHAGNPYTVAVSTPSFRACPRSMPGGTPIGYERFQIAVSWDDLNNAGLLNSSNTNNEFVTVNCEAIPWFGNSSTIAKTADKAFRVETGDGPLRLFKSSTARRYGYISSGASGGTISTDAAAARLAPFPSLSALTAAAGATTDNLIVRVRKNMENLTLGLPAASRPQRGFGYVIEPDEQDDFSATGGRIALPWDTNQRPRNTLLAGITDMDRCAMEFRRILWTRTSASFAGDTVNNDLVFVDCVWNDAGTGSFLGSNPHRAFHFDNIFNRTGATGGTLSPTGVGAYHRWFGCRITALSTTSVSMQTRALVGCFGDCLSTISTGNSSSPRDNVHWCYTVLYDLKGSLAPVDSGSTPIDHINRNSLVIIPVSTNVGDVFSLYSGEVGGGTSGCPQIVGHYEYYVGRELVCRRNGPYDISSDGARTLGIIDHAGAVYGGRTAEKCDLYPGMSTRTGTRNMSHGVDCEGQVKGSYDQFPLWAPGWGALWTEPPQNSPTNLGYVAWNSVTVDGSGAFVAGTRVATPNMDDYRPTSAGTIGQQQMKRQMNRFDLFGNLRSANGLPGVWATPA